MLGVPPQLFYNFFVTEILGIRPKFKDVLFQSLETLQLSGVCFDQFESQFGQAFNMMNLRTLQLRNCIGSLHLLKSLVGEDATLRLTSLELAIDLATGFSPGYPRNQQVEIMCDVLDSLKELENLFLLLVQPIEWYHIINAIARHQSTLKRLVLHEKRSLDDETVDGGTPWQCAGELLFHGFSVSCIGTSGPISEMVRPDISPCCALLTLL
jgi:hypothetical protein